MKLALHWQILIAMVTGLIFALALGEHSAFVEPLGTIFIRLLKMVIVPLVLVSIIVGVAGVGSSGGLGRLGAKTFGYYLMSSFLAVLIGLFLCNMIKPGTGVEIETEETFSADSLDKPDSVVDILLRIIPENPIEAMTEFDMLGIIFFAILFGVTLSRVSDSYRDSLLPALDAVFKVMMTMTRGIIKLAPIGVFGLIVRAVNHTDARFFQAVALYMVTIAVGLTIHLFIVLPVIYAVFMKRNPVEHYRNMLNAMLTAFSTSSSAATLPVTMQCVEENSGVSNRVSSFVLPMGATVNMDGTAIYECAGVLFIAQVLGVDLSVGQQAVVVLTALLASVGAAAVPSAGLVVIFIVLEAVGLQGPTVDLIVGTMLAVDRPLDMYRTVVNIFSDSVGTVVIARSENAISPPNPN